MIVETEDGVYTVCKDFVAKRIFFSLRPMYRAIKFDDETKFMAMKISDEKTLPSFHFIEERKLSIKFQTEKIPISKDGPKFFFCGSLPLTQFPTLQSSNLS